MKKLILCIAIALLAINTNAQIKKGFYAGGSLGYNFANSANSNAIYGDLFRFYNSTETPASNSFEMVKLSLGKGFNIGGHFGYMFNKNLGAEMGLGFLLGGETSSTRNDFPTISTTTIKSNQIQIKPALVIAAGYEKINPYAKLGIVMGANKTIFTDSELNLSNGNTIDTEAELTGGMMLGLRGTAGISYAITSNIALFAEITSISGNVKPTEGEITVANENGVSQLGALTYNESHVEFVDSHTYAAPESDNEAHNSPRPSFSGSSIGFNFGMSYHF